jgi:hypothetical protein
MVTGPKSLSDRAAISEIDVLWITAGVVAKPIEEVAASARINIAASGEQLGPRFRSAEERSRERREQSRT